MVWYASADNGFQYDYNSDARMHLGSTNWNQCNVAEEEEII